MSELYQKREPKRTKVESECSSTAPIGLTAEQIKRLAETPFGKKRVIDAFSQDQYPINNWELRRNLARCCKGAIRKNEKDTGTEHTYNGKREMSTSGSKEGSHFRPSEQRGSPRKGKDERENEWVEKFPLGGMRQYQCPMDFFVCCRV